MRLPCGCRRVRKAAARQPQDNRTKNVRFIVVSGWDYCQSIKVFHLRMPQVNRTAAVRQPHDSRTSTARPTCGSLACCHQYCCETYDSRTTDVQPRTTALRQPCEIVTTFPANIVRPVRPSYDCSTVVLRCLRIVCGKPILRNTTTKKSYGLCETGLSNNFCYV